MTDEPVLNQVMEALRQLTVERPLSPAAESFTCRFQVERGLLFGYMGVLVPTVIATVIAAMASSQDAAEPYIMRAFFVSLVLVIAYVVTAIINLAISNLGKRKDPNHGVFQRLHRDMTEDWEALNSLRVFPKPVVEYALMQYRWRWETLEGRVALFSGDLRRLGLVPALAASAAAASALIKQDGSVLLWAPVVLASCFYITGFVLLASRERPKQVVELLSYLLRNWEAEKDGAAGTATPVQTPRR